MHLHGHRLAAGLIEHLEAVHQGDGHDGAAGLGGAAEAAAVEFQHLVTLTAAGALREDQVGPAALNLSGDVLNHRQRLANVLTIHGKGLGAKGDLVQEGNVVQLFFQHRADGPVAGGGDGQNVEHSLMVGVQHKAALRGDVLLSRDLHIHIAAGDGMPQNILNVLVFFNFGIVAGVVCVFTELEPGTGYDPQIFQHHGNDSIHVGFLSGGDAACLLEAIIPCLSGKFKQFFRLQKEMKADLSFQNAVYFRTGRKAVLRILPRSGGENLIEFTFFPVHFRFFWYNGHRLARIGSIRALLRMKGDNSCKP